MLGYANYKKQKRLLKHPLRRILILYLFIEYRITQKIEVLTDLILLLLIKYKEILQKGVSY